MDLQLAQTVIPSIFHLIISFVFFTIEIVILNHGYEQPNVEINETPEIIEIIDDDF